MPPPRLHPRSRTTSSLFLTTVAASFLVVALPHLLPCPVAPARYADDDEGPAATADGMPPGRRRCGPDEARRRRACPVPKPGGLLGHWLGFHAEPQPPPPKP